MIYPTEREDIFIVELPDRPLDEFTKCDITCYLIVDSRGLSIYYAYHQFWRRPNPKAVWEAADRYPVKLSPAHVATIRSQLMYLFWDHFCQAGIVMAGENMEAVRRWLVSTGLPSPSASSGVGDTVDLDSARALLGPGGREA